MKDYISGIAGLLVSLYVFLEAMSFSTMEDGLAGNPAMYPIALAFLLALLSLALLIMAMHRREKVAFSFNRALCTNVGIFMVAMVLYALLIGVLGFVLTTLAFTIFMINYLGGSRKQSIIYGVPFTIIVYLSFSLLLKVPLPKGFIGF